MSEIESHGKRWSETVIILAEGLNAVESDPLDRPALRRPVVGWVQNGL